MIRWNNLLKILGIFVLALTASLAITSIYALLTHDASLVSFLWTTFITGILGFFLFQFFSYPSQELTHREGIVLVVTSWVTAITLGTLPFYFSGYFPEFTAAFFESTSGFTTTGATIVDDIEALPKSLLLWRALTHWIGGMGIIVLSIAILPLIGTGGMELYRAEFSGARSEKLTPRIAETAAALWKLYLAFTVMTFLALRWAGMNSFDAICHAFSTMATGGFSTRNESIESFANPAIEYVIIFFMIVAGINFTQHYRLLIEHKSKSFFRDPELRLFIGIIVAATTVIAITLSFSSITLPHTFRTSLFQAVSILTGTGLTSSNFGIWPPFAQLVLLALMFTGGCTGSTTGGLKIARIYLLFSVVGREFKRMVERRGVFSIRFDQGVVTENTVQSLLNLIYLAFLINFAACMALTAFGVDVLTAISAVAACMFNIGPGLGSVGPAENYAHLPNTVKWILSFCMLAGRLEFYTVLIIFTGSFWRK